ncbi:MAG: hypothetical protein SGBAC_006457 [Bacillariaceae sp.]
MLSESSNKVAKNQSRQLPVPIPTNVITAAVEEYGEAWKTQDWQRIGRLFSKDAIYVERVFDKKATFRGRRAIRDYWKRQICGKQSNIQFRYLEKEVVRDADQPIAVVKWLAAFDNTRHCRGPEATHKQVRFCQMAKLVFVHRESIGEDHCDDISPLLKEYQISYLEEYAQAMGGSGVRWPTNFVTDSSESLWTKLRLDPPPPPPPSVCDNCGTSFPSRTKLFAHLQSTTPVTSPGGGGTICRELADKQVNDPPVWLCWSLAYQNSINIAQDFLLLFQSHPELSAVQPETTEFMIWAIPPELVPSQTALVTVVTTKVTHQSILETISQPLDKWPELLNKVSDMIDAADAKIHIHTVGKVESPCVPERRELERYRCYIPWRSLQSTPSRQQQDDDNVAAPPRFSRERNCWRTPIDETAAYQHLDPNVLQRLQMAARLAARVSAMKSSSNKEKKSEETGTEDSIKKLTSIRIRASTMEEPWERICQLSISFKQPCPGCVGGILRLLLRYAGVADISSAHDNIGSTMGDEAFQTELIHCMSSSNDIQAPPFPFPTLLVEPSLTKYESKMKLPLTQDCFFASDVLKRSIEASSNSICSKILTDLDQFTKD